MFRRLLIVNLIGWFCVLAPVLAPDLTPWGGAAASDVFTIRNVEVNEKASSELTAKTKALAAGQRTALAAMFKRVTMLHDHGRLPEATDKLVTELVRDFAVSEEKFGGGRYLGKLSVRFRPKQVRNLLQQMDIPFAETASRPLVVLPVLAKGKSQLLWDEPNPWFDIWGELASPDGLLPLLMPHRELSDVSLITAEQASAGHLNRLRAVAQKYNTRGVVVPVAEFSVIKAKKVQRVEIKLITFSSTGHVKKALSAYESQPGMSEAEFHKQVALVLIQQLEEDWKQANLLTGGNVNALVAIVPVTKLADWLAVKERLAQVATVKHVGVRRMSVRETEVAIRFQGAPDQLRVALEQNGLRLSSYADQNVWMLERFDR